MPLRPTLELQAFQNLVHDMAGHATNIWMFVEIIERCRQKIWLDYHVAIDQADIGLRRILKAQLWTETAAGPRGRLDLHNLDRIRLCYLYCAIRGPAICYDYFHFSARQSLQSALYSLGDALFFVQSFDDNRNRHR